MMTTNARKSVKQPTSAWITRSVTTLTSPTDTTIKIIVQATTSAQRVWLEWPELTVRTCHCWAELTNFFGTWDPRDLNETHDVHMRKMLFAELDPPPWGLIAQLPVSDPQVCQKLYPAMYLKMQEWHDAAPASEISAVFHAGVHKFPDAVVSESTMQTISPKLEFDVLLDALSVPGLNTSIAIACTMEVNRRLSGARSVLQGHTRVHEQYDHCLNLFHLVKRAAPSQHFPDLYWFDRWLPESVCTIEPSAMPVDSSSSSDNEEADHAEDVPDHANQYEELRQRNMRRNEEKLKSLGLDNQSLRPAKARRTMRPRRTEEDYKNQNREDLGTDRRRLPKRACCDAAKVEDMSDDDFEPQPTKRRAKSQFKQTQPKKTISCNETLEPNWSHGAGQLDRWIAYTESNLLAAYNMYAFLSEFLLGMSCPPLHSRKHEDVQRSTLKFLEDAKSYMKTQGFSNRSLKDFAHFSFQQFS
jgi:hypothetical protein